MKKNKSMACLLLGMTALLLTGCISEEERAQAEAWRKQAEKNAVEYIEEKYGFEAKVLESETQKRSDLFGAKLTSTALVTMEYDGKQFNVLSDGADEYTDEASDNYQKEELVAALKEEVTALFGVKPDSFDVMGGDNEDSADVNDEAFFDMFYHIYYDGTNLEEVLTSEPLYCLAEYVGDVDLDGLYEQNKTALFEHRFVHAGFVTYDSKEDMDLSVIRTNGNFENSIYMNALYVKDALLFEKEEAQLFDLSIGQCEDFYYLNVNADVSQYKVAKKVEQYKADDWNGHGFKHATFASDMAYYIEGNAESKLYVYVPKEKYEQIPSGDHGETVVIASRCISEKTGEDSYDIWFHEGEIPGYEVYYNYNVDAKDYSFRFMYDDRGND